MSRIIFFLSDEELRFDIYLYEWNLSLTKADNLTELYPDLGPRGPIRKGNIFKLTLKNIELSLYFSLRFFCTSLSQYQKCGDMYKYRRISWIPVCSCFLNDITYLRPNLFQDRFIPVKRNKFKFFYLFLLFIMVVEYYIPTLIIRNEMLEIMKEAIDNVENNNNNIINMVEMPNDFLNRVLIDSMIENSSNKLIGRRNSKND